MLRFSEEQAAAYRKDPAVSKMTATKGGGREGREREFGRGGRGVEKRSPSDPRAQAPNQASRSLPGPDPSVPACQACGLAPFPHVGNANAPGTARSAAV